MAGLEERAAAGKPIDGIASVASFFVSRVDTEVDKRLDALAQRSKDAGRELGALHGQGGGRQRQARVRTVPAAVRRRSLARPRRQRRPRCSARCGRAPAPRTPRIATCMYVEELIGPDTVNTMPPGTIEAFRDHGEVKRTVDAELDRARRGDSRPRAGRRRRCAQVTDKLLVDGLASFQKSFDTLLAGLEKKSQQLGRELVPRAERTLHPTVRTQTLSTHSPHQDRLHARARSARHATALRGLIEAGLNVARINFSHGTHEQHAATDRDVCAPWPTRCGRPIAILGDLQGPRIRIGDLAQPFAAGRRRRRRARARGDAQRRRDPRHVRRPGATTCTSATASSSTTACSSSSCSTSKGRACTARVLHGGLLKSHKGMNLPGRAGLRAVDHREGPRRHRVRGRRRTSTTSRSASCGARETSASCARLIPQRDAHRREDREGLGAREHREHRPRIGRRDGGPRRSRRGAAVRGSAVRAEADHRASPTSSAGR